MCMCIYVRMYYYKPNEKCRKTFKKWQTTNGEIT